MSNADAFRNLAQDVARAQVKRTKRQGERTKRIAEIKKETSNLLRGFDEAHSEMSAQLRAELSEMKGEIEKETSNLLRGFDEAHSEMSAQLRAELSETKGEIKKETSGLLKGFGKERSDMSAQLKSELAKGEKARKSEVKNLLEGFRRDSTETAAAWRELVATMQAERGVAVAPRRVKPRKVAKIVAAVAEEMPVKEVVPEGRTRLEEHILSMIGDHPDGIKLTEIAEETGVARIKAGNVTRMLVDEGKVIKEGLFYFPV